MQEDKIIRRGRENSHSLNYQKFENVEKMFKNIVTQKPFPER
jgi:hypothetical protein